MPTNIYLDVDGVLVTQDGEAAPYADEFLTYVIQKFPLSTYWLTTHCKGNAEDAVRAVAFLLKPKTGELLHKIQATNWDIAKTEAIDFEAPFLWFDDMVFEYEQSLLAKRGLLSNWINVDLEKEPDQLQKYIDSFPTPVQPLAT